MARALAVIVLAATLFTAARAQSTTAEGFEAADVHVTAHSTSPYPGTAFRGGRYEIRNASIVDLVSMAYAIDANKVEGGPNWVEFDRFDVIAKAAPGTPRETINTRLQTLLAERFKLAVHKDTKSIAGFALTMGKGKHKLREADPSGSQGCQRQPQQPITAVNGQVQIPVNTFSCHKVTMETFAAQLRGMDPTYFSNAVVDSTGLQGSWDFELKFTLKTMLQLTGSEGVTIADAVDKQLGLKIEEQKIPTPVVVIDQVTRKATDNPPDTESRLPALPPAEFEVAEIKPWQPGARPAGPIFLGFQPGGRVNLPGFPLQFVVNLAWNLNGIADIQGAPKWLSTAQFDIVAKAPAAYVSSNGLPTGMDDLAPMLQALLIDRFKMKVHFEDQQVTAYTLVATKPKLKKADPASRIGCKLGNGPNAAPAGTPFSLPSRVITCQNITMAQFVDQLQNIAGTAYLRYPVLDGTGLDGAWDFSFSFSPIPPAQLAGLRGAPPPGATGGAADAAAADPVAGVSLFEAVEKQLGLKLESQKRTYPVFVIDHMEEKPTEN